LNFSHPPAKLIWAGLLLVILVLATAACSRETPLPAEPVRQQVQAAWLADRHTTWEIDWPNAPVGGPLTVESWQAENRYRYEILETAAPALLGEVLVFDGAQAWRYNWLTPDTPPQQTPPQLSPVTDAFESVSALLNQPPVRANIQADTVLLKPARKVTLTFENGDTLVAWFDAPTQSMLLQLIFNVGEQQGRLIARHSEPLVTPDKRLFSVTDREVIR
jgi:hypothetical protein